MAGRDFSSTDGVYLLRVALGSYVSFPLGLSHKLVWCLLLHLLHPLLQHSVPVCPERAQL